MVWVVYLQQVGVFFIFRDSTSGLGPGGLGPLVVWDWVVWVPLSNNPFHFRVSLSYPKHRAPNHQAKPLAEGSNS